MPSTPRRVPGAAIARGAMAAVVLALALALSSVTGCSSAAPLTELVVVVSADLPVATLRVTATSPEGTQAFDARVASPTFPLSVVMTRDHAPYGPVTIHVEGGGVISDTQTELAVGERRRLDVQLTSRCLCAACGASETCRAGSCETRTVAASTLPRWEQGSDASVARPRDAGASGDAAVTPDAGPSGTTCGCMGQPCCAGACNATFSCRLDVCRDCVTNAPTVTGMTPAGAVALTAISGVNDTLWVSASDGTSTGQEPLVLGGGVTATGTAVLTQIVGVTTSGAAMFVRGPAASMGTITLSGATLSGAFIAPSHTDGTEGEIVRAVGAGDTITLTAWDGSTGTIRLVAVEACR